MKNLLLSEYLLILFLIVLFLVTGCAKYLDAVPDKSLAVPNSVADYQALLENEIMFTDMPALAEIGTDDIYLPDALWAGQPIFVRDAYHWSKDLNEGVTSLNWNNPYKKIYYANLVLDGVDKLKNKHNATDIQVLKGWALFCRAHAFYDLQEIFGQPYRPASANNDLGIPLRLNTDLQEKTPRATVETTFQQIVKDLEQAIPLLPDGVSKTDRSKPGKPAAYALLARVCLTMQNYDRAVLNADRCLLYDNQLVDYNTLNATVRAPFSPLIDEVIYNAVQISYSTRSWQIGQDFYQLYAADDLRKTLFFTVDPVAKTVVFKGFYNAVLAGFDGLATDEVYLIKAECEARLGHDAIALDALNTLLLKRFKTGEYVPYSTGSVSDVLSLILLERRKECLFRNLRWSDLRRLNQDVRFAKTLTRMVDGQRYQLPPNNPRYTLPIPDDEIRANKIQQNIR
ncbi:RagB/SusD family nutrient uptake outer membrane protein [Pedobacter hartonius]|nr:RagB/SusD family nutrient uptake outer membrane protein [Pedobacter hartonius]